MQSFINSVIDGFIVSQSAVRVAFVRYADSADVPFYLYYYNDNAGVKNAASSVSLLGGGSNLASGLDTARNYVFSMARPNAWQIAVVVADHFPSSSSQQALNAANNAKAVGIQIIPVGINADGQMDTCDFFSVASDSLFYLTNDFSKLANVVARIAGFACMSGTPPATTISTSTTTSTSTTKTTSAATRTTSSLPSAAAPPTTTKTPTMTAGSYCSNTVLEMVFAVDSSSKSDSSAWPSMLSFVNSVISKFYIGPNAVRVAFVSYSDSASVVFGLGSYGDTYSLQSAISAIPLIGGGSNPAAALDAVRTQVLTSSAVRQNVLKILITVADQLPTTSYNGLYNAINNARSAAIRMYGVGIVYVSGRSLDSDALYQLSFNTDQSNPWQATWVYGYSDLPNRVGQVVQYACVNG
jgi:hypothetical protein